MSYCDYGAFVWKNGKRMRNYEDAECFGIKGLDCVHGLIKDDRIEVICYKQGLPLIYLDGKRVDYEGDRDPYTYEAFSTEIGGYYLIFHSGCDVDTPYEVKVFCPNGDQWVCRYDYAYGAGFDAISLYNLLGDRIKAVELELDGLLNDKDKEETSYLEGLLEGLEFAQRHSKMIEYNRK